MDSDETFKFFNEKDLFRAMNSHGAEGSNSARGLKDERRVLHKVSPLIKTTDLKCSKVGR